MKIYFLLLILAYSISAEAKEYRLESPDNQLSIGIEIRKGISVKSYFQNRLLFEVENIYLELAEGQSFGKNPKIKKTDTKEINELITPAIKEKSAEIKNHYNELTIWFQGDYGLCFRAFNNGLAYRFFTQNEGAQILNYEHFEFQASEGDSVWYQSTKTFNSSYETPYVKDKISDIEEGKLCNLPILVTKENGMYVFVSESDLTAYPGLWLTGTGRNKLISTHPKYPDSYTKGNNLYGYHQVATTREYMAQISGPRTFPWRIFSVAENEAELLINDLVYILASEQKISDATWITPGVVAFDWWGRRNIFGVDFEAGVNTETAEYFIDFCAKYNFQYFLFDDGWSPLHDIMDPVAELNMEEISAYARKRDVDLMLWVHWYGLSKNMEAALDLFQKWGIKGIKVDFMNRDDQEMVIFYEKVASECAKRKMVVNYHGAYKPAGLRRAYPNVLTREALIEFEYNGMNKWDDPVHHNLLPYLRLVTGPMDYIPATMRNGTKSNHRVIGDYPMGQGTRAHALAMFVILSSPITMLPDSPSDYYIEEECIDFIADIPVVWDELKVLQANMGKNTALARRKGDTWYIAAITNWDRAKMEIGLDFLENKNYNLTYIADGPNADRRAGDYILKEEIVSNSETLHLKLASGGGWIGQLKIIE
jgi:alpha-glucosidase